MSSGPSSLFVPPDLYRTLTLQGRFLLVVSVAAGLLLVLALGLALFALRSRWIATRKGRLQAKLSRRWTPPTLEALAGERSLEEVWSLVEARHALRFLQFLLPYARRLVGAERKRVTALAEPFLEELRPSLDDKDPNRRARAVRTLGTLGLPKQGKALVGFLDDPSPFVAMEAAQALAMYGAREDARELVRHLDRFQDWNREHLVSLLRGLGARVGPELRAMVDESEPVPSPTRAVAVEALRAFHDLESVDLTPHVLSTESDPDILAATLRLVAELGQPAHVEAVRPHLASPHFAVRAAAFQALGALGGRDDLAQLRAGVDDPSPWVARQAARGLRSCGGRETLRALVKAGHARATLAAEVLAEEPA